MREAMGVFCRLSLSGTLDGRPIPKGIVCTDPECDGKIGEGGRIICYRKKRHLKAVDDAETEER